MESLMGNVSLVASSNVTVPLPDASSQSTDNCASFRFVFYTILVGSLSILGLLGNMLSILVLQKDRRNKIAVFLLQSLAVADSLVLILSFFVLSIIYGLLPYAKLSHTAASIIPYVVKYVHPFGYAAQCCTIWITVLLAANRYVAVVKPFLSTRLCTLTKARISVGMVFTIATLFNAPRFFQYTIIREYVPMANGTNRSMLILNNSAIGEYSLFGFIYTNIIYTIIVLLVPLFIIVVLNWCLVRELKFPSDPSYAMTGATVSNGSSAVRRRRRSCSQPPLPEEQNITFIMVTIIVVFLVCHTPDRIFQIVRYNFTSHMQLKCGNTLYYVSSVCNLLIVINSSTNFIVYYFLRRSFRRILMKKICAWRNFTKYKETPSYLENHVPVHLLEKHNNDGKRGDTDNAKESSYNGGLNV